MFTTGPETPSQHSRAAPGRLRSASPSPGRTGRSARSFVPERLYDHHLSAANPFWMGVSENQPPEAPDVHVHNGFEVGITLAGLVEVQFGRYSIATRAGEVALCNMWEPHQATPTEAGNSIVAVIFLPEFLASGDRDAASWMSLFSAAPEHRPRARSARVREMVLSIGRRLSEELDGRRRGWERMVRLDLLRLLLVLEREWRPPRRMAAQPDLFPAEFGRLLPAVSLVHADLSRRVSCVEGARSCGFSEPHFRSLFRRAMGVSFGWFSLRARLGFAAHCLAATGLPLRQVVEATGFADLSHFHRVFERHFGCNPTQFRQRSREAQPPGPRTARGRRQRFTSRASIYDALAPEHRKPLEG
jgi:AraC-like DNA-binding protein